MRASVSLLLQESSKLIPLTVKGLNKTEGVNERLNVLRVHVPLQTEDIAEKN
jgi:hypothetical protein